MALTFFAAPLRCPSCGKTFLADSSTRMENQLSEEPWTVYRVGDAVPDGDDDLRGAFIPAHTRQGSETRILQHWICPSEGTHQWAEVVLGGGRAREIAAVELTPELLGRIHYASEDIVEHYLAQTGEDLFQAPSVPRPDWPERLGGALRLERGP